jgi:hypothetical protein
LRAFCIEVLVAVAPASLGAKLVSAMICEYSGDPVGLAESSRPSAIVPHAPRSAT